MAKVKVLLEDNKEYEFCGFYVKAYRDPSGIGYFLYGFNDPYESFYRHTIISYSQDADVIFDKLDIFEEMLEEASHETDDSKQ